MAAGVSASAIDWRLSSLEVEGIRIANPKNQVAIPNNADRFDLRDLTGRGMRTGGRVTLFFGERGSPQIRLMLAPLSLSGVGQLSGPVSFNGTNFAGGVDTRGRYQFNSYRVSYVQKWGGYFSAGGTLKIRDAYIELEQGATRARKTDLGLVPLFYLAAEVPLTERLSFNADLDASWAPQGRAIDLGARLHYAVDRKTELFAGVRMLEGGADVDAVYNFAQFNSWTLGVRLRF